MKLGKIVTMVYYNQNYHRMYPSQFLLNKFKIDIFGNGELLQAFSQQKRKRGGSFRQRFGKINRHQINFSFLCLDRNSMAVRKTELPPVLPIGTNKSRRK